MEPLSRLDSLSPELSEMFRTGSAAQRRNAVAAACSRAILDADLHGGDIDAAMDKVRSDAVDVGLADRLHALSSDFDDKYFELSDGDGPAQGESLLFFGKARASAALALAISEDRSELHEALYEAISASNDEADAIQATMRELTQS